MYRPKHDDTLTPASKKFEITSVVGGDRLARPNGWIRQGGAESWSRCPSVVVMFVPPSHSSPNDCDLHPGESLQSRSPIGHCDWTRHRGRAISTKLVHTHKALRLNLVAHARSFAPGHVCLLAHEISVALTDAHGHEDTVARQTEVADVVSHEVAAVLDFWKLQQIDGFQLIEAIDPDAAAFGVFSSALRLDRKVVPLVPDGMMPNSPR